MEVLEGGGEGNRGSREDKAGCNDVAFNYPPISPECLKGQPLHNQHTDTHTTHYIPLCCIPKTSHRKFLLLKGCCFIAQGHGIS